MNTTLQRGDLPAIEYFNVEKRAEEAKGFFTKELRIHKDNVQVHKNLDKAEVLAVFR